MSIDYFEPFDAATSECVVADTPLDAVVRIATNNAGQTDARAVYGAVRFNRTAHLLDVHMHIFNPSTGDTRCIVARYVFFPPDQLN